MILSAGRFLPSGTKNCIYHSNLASSRSLTANQYLSAMAGTRMLALVQPCRCSCSPTYQYVLHTLFDRGMMKRFRSIRSIFAIHEKKKGRAHANPFRMAMDRIGHEHKRNTADQRPNIFNPRLIFLRGKISAHARQSGSRWVISKLLYNLSYIFYR